LAFAARSIFAGFVVVLYIWLQQHCARVLQSSVRGSMGCCQTATAQVPPSTRSAVLLDVSVHERAIAELKRVFEGVGSNEQGYARKAELSDAFQQAQGLLKLIKKSGLNERQHILCQLANYDGDYISWDDFLQCAWKAVEQHSEPDPISAAAAGEEVLRRLKDFFDSLKADEDGAIGLGELERRLPELLEEGQGDIEKLIARAGFNPCWKVLDNIPTNLYRHISWESFKAHICVVAPPDPGSPTSLASLVEDHGQVGEAVLGRLHKIFLECAVDDDGAVTKTALGSRLQEVEKCAPRGEPIPQLIDKACFNPAWNRIDQLDTSRDGYVTWHEFKAHICGVTYVEEVIVDETPQCCGCL